MRMPKDYNAAGEERLRLMKERQAKDKAKLKKIEQEQMRQAARMLKAVGVMKVHPLELVGVLIDAQKKLESEHGRAHARKAGEAWFRRRRDEQQPSGDAGSGGDTGTQDLAAA